MSNSYKRAMDKIVLSDELKEKIINSASEKHTKRRRIKYARRITEVAACAALCTVSCFAVYRYNADNAIPSVTPIPAMDDTAVFETANNSEETVPDLPEEGQSSKKSRVSHKAVPAETNSTDEFKEETAYADSAISAVGDTSDKMPVLAFGTSAGGGMPSTAHSMKSFSASAAFSGMIEESAAVQGIEDAAYEPSYIPPEYEMGNMSVTDSGVTEITYNSESDTIYCRASKESDDIGTDSADYEIVEKLEMNDTEITLKGADELYYTAEWSDENGSYYVSSDEGLEKQTMLDVVENIN